ncbi:hypothetical protein [Pseudomonas sp. 3JA]|uniref:hypothetical protein n=1 Tax=Pseudomonas sp. 3JA TaxID=3109347 RepID=UPI0030088D6D
MSHIDPALRSEEDSGTAELALSQTIVARTLLYYPGYSLVQELGEAAGTLYDLIQNLNPEDQKTLSKRLFGQGGILFGERIDVLFDTLARVRDEHQMPYALKAVTGRDRVIVIALMGDIGELYAGTAVKGSEREVQEQSDALKNLNYLMRARGLPVLTDNVIRDIQKEGGFYVAGPLKKTERVRPSAELRPLIGIHNVGEKADKQIGVPLEKRIPRVEWSVPHLSESRVLETTEPLVGHMSGSPVEILQVWDMLRGDAHDRQFLGRLQQKSSIDWEPLSNDTLERKDQKLARASGAAAFLIGMGYHSAVEVSEAVLLYMGQDLRQVLDDPAQDAAHLLGHGAATDLIEEMLKGQTVVSNSIHSLP